MRNRKKESSLFNRICSKIFNWAAGVLISNLPVIGPIYKVVTLVNDVHAATRKKHRYAAA